MEKFQENAAVTDHTVKRFDSNINRGAVVSLLGLSGELGSLCATYKKYLRDGSNYILHREHLIEELGDILWYVAATASKFGISLEEVAKKNFEKTSSRWVQRVRQATNYDIGAPRSQRMPREFTIIISEHKVEGNKKAVMRMGRKLLGDPLTDNATIEDGYRFHDVFHIAFLATLGWSPVIRKLMGHKRKFDKSKDETEDGGRAIVIEEGIAALVFEYGSDNGLSKGKHIIDDELLQTLQKMTRRLEIKGVPSFEWQKAVLTGWRVFSLVKKNRGGVLTCNLDRQSLKFQACRAGAKNVTYRLINEAKKTASANAGL
jgi:NTP pyrophosphatase (non-canonical NTP hydrolase)